MQENVARKMLQIGIFSDNILYNCYIGQNTKK